MKICAIVIAYNPDVADLTRNILQYVPLVDRLIVWRNSPIPDLEHSAELFPRFADHIIFLGDGTNTGISRPLNAAADYARANSFTHLLTMDQDSRWENFEAFRDFAASLSNETILVPPLNGRRNPALPTEPIRFFFNSGTLYPLSAIDRIGRFNEDFFIDQIDTDYSIRARKAGISMIQFNGANLVHSLGRSRTVGHHSITEYSPFRLYGINRNSVKLLRKHHNRDALLNFYSCFRKYCMKKTSDILRFEDCKGAKLSAIYRGLLSGIFSRLK